MAKEITEPNEAAKPKTEQVKGVVFVKNNPIEPVILPNGEVFKFEKSKITVYDEATITGLREVAGKFRIFEQ